MTEIQISTTAGRSAWFDLDEYTAVDDLWQDVMTRLKSESAYVEATDFDWDLGLSVNDVNTLDDVWEKIQVIGDAHEPEAMASYLSYYGWDLSMVDGFEDAYSGEWDSLEDYAINFYEEVYGEFNVPGFKIAVDLTAWECDYFTVDTAGGVHVFRYV